MNMLLTYCVCPIPGPKRPTPLTYSLIFMLILCCMTHAHTTCMCTIYIYCVCMYTVCIFMWAVCVYIDILHECWMCLCCTALPYSIPSLPSGVFSPHGVQYSSEWFRALGEPSAACLWKRLFNVARPNMKHAQVGYRERDREQWHSVRTYRFVNITIKSICHSKAIIS